MEPTAARPQEARTVDHPTIVAEVRALRTPSGSDGLSGAPLADVLSWGLVTRPGEPLVEGIIGGARVAVDVLTGYVKGGGYEPEVVEQALDGIGARLDVAGEVLFRLRRAATQEGAP